MYGYNSDGVRVWKQDVLSQQEYRYVCRIGCGGIPMRVYNKAMGGTSWNTLEEYMETPTVIGYTKAEGTFGHYVWISGHWLGDWVAGGGWMYYQDQFGVEVGSEYLPAAPKPAPEYLGQGEGVSSDPCVEGYIPMYALFLQQNQPKPKPTTPYSECLKACKKLREDLENACERKHGECVARCGANDDCLKKCDEDLRTCAGDANLIAAGCADRCGEEHIAKKPPGRVGNPFNPVGDPLIPESRYDDWCKSQPEDPRKKYPGLPTPGGGWPHDKKKK
ncbi:MAG: hypothetical protein KatS3mg023_4056 [Armatimonadota bacterium]|nr:MAG: hypothetical protein KatS3mg023_4056 [Armatimonadota bacterium]